MKPILHKTFKAKFPITMLVAGVCCSLFAQSAFAVTAEGFWATGVINGKSFSANGTGLQLATPLSNPDFLCEINGVGARLPRMGEMNVAYKTKLALSGNNNTTDGAANLRLVGSVISEWGGQPSLYTSSPWVSGSYWVAEPMNTTQRHFVLLNSPTAGTLSASVPTTQQNVMCVQDI
ncbi:hypothetical protein [Thorsellia anophelis]|uniref:Uncharacterized protein n=1 Tax=Thorsellia anophelis DSM 18579 TaxID=1123402 RepID=A0A1H9YFK3_9GAMM|nr:hypothetical protein [Thorsellia anophelis]SES67802.1 hypothetical protein SAMN02583745_00239 [Thorsellia anophelis DSM 18579]